MFGNEDDLLANFLHQTHSGKMSLTTLVQNLPDQQVANISELISDSNGRYLKLQEIHRDDSVFSTLTVRRKTSELSMKERYNYLANQFMLSSLTIEKQYELALRNRIEIPPLLMRRILVDAIGILGIMREQFNQDREKFQRISKRLKQLETWNQFFDRHC